MKEGLGGRFWTMVHWTNWRVSLPVTRAQQGAVAARDVAELEPGQSGAAPRHELAQGRAEPHRGRVRLPARRGPGHRVRRLGSQRARGARAGRLRSRRRGASRPARLYDTELGPIRAFRMYYSCAALDDGDAATRGSRRAAVKPRLVLARPQPPRLLPAGAAPRRRALPRPARLAVARVARRARRAAPSRRARAGAAPTSARVLAGASPRRARRARGRRPSPTSRVLRRSAQRQSAPIRAGPRGCWQRRGRRASLAAPRGGAAASVLRHRASRQLGARRTTARRRGGGRAPTWSLVRRGRIAASSATCA